MRPQRIWPDAPNPVHQPRKLAKPRFRPSQREGEASQEGEVANWLGAAALIEIQMPAHRGQQRRGVEWFRKDFVDSVGLNQ